MPLKRYATQAEIPEALRSEYVERDGAWIPDVENAEDLFASGVKASQRKLLDDLKKAQAALKAYDGVDAEEYRALKTAADDAQEKAAKAAGNWEARESQLKTQFEKELQRLTAERDSLRGTVEDLVVENELRRELAPIVVDVDLALPHVRPGIRPVLDEATKRWVAQVVDEKGNPRIGDRSGAGMTIAQRVKEWSEDPKFAPLVKGTGASGAGARGSDARAGTKQTISASDPQSFLANVDKIARGEVLVAP